MMKITLESTSIVTAVALDGGALVRCRRWRGVTEGGVPVVALIPRISPQTHDPAVAALFEAELMEADALPEFAGAPVDEERTAALVATLMNAVTESGDGFVALNGLAVAAALVLAGASNEDRARCFFETALAGQLAELLRCAGPRF